MKRILILPLVLMFIFACQPAPEYAPEAPLVLQATDTSTSTFTPIPSFTSTPTIKPPPTATTTQSILTAVIVPIRENTFTPTPTPEPTDEPTGESPGVALRGSVTSPDGAGITGVQIFYAFSAYPGNLLATTDSQGSYDGFIFIPSDETIRVWAQLSGYSFKPGEGSKSWMGGEFSWRHYAGFENVRLGFVGTPE